MQRRFVCFISLVLLLFMGVLPTAAQDDALPPPVMASSAAGGFELGGHVLQLNPNTISLVRRSGMAWVKFQVKYRLGNRPEIVAGLIQTAHANNFKVLLSVVGVKSQMGDYRRYIERYSQFVGGVAALGADAIEVWNEPNIDREWPAGRISGQRYTRLLAGAYNAIKRRNPSTMVISGAPAPTGYFGGRCTTRGCDDDVFLAAMARAGAAKYLDCVGQHYNEGIVGPNVTSGDPRSEHPTRYLPTMVDRGYRPFGGKPVCFTELGYLTAEGWNRQLPRGFEWAASTSLAEHARWLGGAAARLRNDSRVRLMIVWNVDFPLFTSTDPMGGYAIFRPNHSCPACDTLGAAMR